MAKKSPISTALQRAFEEHFLPLLTPLGFTPQRPERTRPGLVVALATRPLDPSRRVDVTLWCDGATGSNLRFRVDLVGPINGVECHDQVDLKVPWPETDAPQPRSLDFSGAEFLTHESPERLQLAVEFLAGALATSAEALGLAIPELAGDLERLKVTSPFRSASARSAELWSARHMRGEIDPRASAAVVVFVGNRLVTVDAEGTRLSFRFDTARFDRTLPVSVSHWFSTPAATRRALALTNGPVTWRFDPRGQLLTIEG